jgi:hypothetical protein
MLSLYPTPSSPVRFVIITPLYASTPLSKMKTTLLSFVNKLVYTTVTNDQQEALYWYTLYFLNQDATLDTKFRNQINEELLLSSGNVDVVFWDCL